MQQTITLAIRATKPLRDWVRFPDSYLQRGSYGFLKLLLTEKAIQQATASGLQRLFSAGQGKIQERPPGGSVVISIRLPVWLVTLIEQQAASKNMNRNDWCVHSIYIWQKTFSVFYKKYSQDVEVSEHIFSNYAENYAQRVDKLIEIYAQRASLTPVTT